MKSRHFIIMLEVKKNINLHLWRYFLNYFNVFKQVEGETSQISREVHFVL